MTELRKLTSVRKSSRSQTTGDCVGCEWIKEEPDLVVWVDTKNLHGGQVHLSKRANQAFLAWLSNG